jgi:hypothetical protein
MEINYINIDELVIAPFKATYILRPDLLVLSRSLYDLGFIAPLIVQKSTNIVIDGNERLSLVKNQKQIREKTGDTIPVIYIDCDSLDAQMLHIRINRSRGSMLAKPVSSIIRNIIKSKKYKKEDLDSILQMKHDEYQLMIDGSLLKHRKISEHKYSRAWVPVEAPAGTLDSGPVTETPPNSDR